MHAEVEVTSHILLPFSRECELHTLIHTLLEFNLAQDMELVRNGEKNPH